MRRGNVSATIGNAFNQRQWEGITTKSKYVLSKRICRDLPSFGRVI